MSWPHRMIGYDVRLLKKAEGRSLVRWDGFGSFWRWKTCIWQEVGFCKWNTIVSLAKNACFEEQLFAIKPIACLANIISGGNLGSHFGKPASLYFTPCPPRVQHEGDSPDQSKARHHMSKEAELVSSESSAVCESQCSPKGRVTRELLLPEALCLDSSSHSDPLWSSV